MMLKFFYIEKYWEIIVCVDVGKWWQIITCVVVAIFYIKKILGNNYLRWY